MATRRRVLAAVGASLAVGLAGCLEEDEEGEFLVTDAHPVPDGRNLRYHVSIENSRPSREEGTLELTLVYDPEGGERERWEKSDNVSLGRGQSVQQTYVFENVYEDTNDLDDYELEGEIVPVGG